MVNHKSSSCQIRAIKAPVSTKTSQKIGYVLGLHGLILLVNYPKRRLGSASTSVRIIMMKIA